ncbi:Protein of unknown function DUF1814 [Penicillium expansum]|uniref:Uncharacterized protein n=1 Tax=Penicillium expansum TaxID=27334 RepID=A0A0A2JPZ8_PENEN|nr:Protein of unknown function DUF1814 [Penicillium expansum]KGO45942.1 Protein of unknown function DUF1814 [Penicillium expansum]KGO54330.1 Protein of unknown function DUF1814 [Penicillium expansum]KGO61869.1 Protein of unknown function DUF1814 [Penicillium expansum]
MPVLLPPQLEHVVATVAHSMDLLQVDYALMGGAAVCLTAPDPSRRTEDVDLVIHVDQRAITADLLTQRLMNSFPSDFGPVSQFGHVIPAYKLRLPEGSIQLVEVEIFDFPSWPNRPQYNLQTATRVTKTVNGYSVKMFSAEWLTREKLLSQYQRQGVKHATDIEDLSRLMRYCMPQKPELNFDQDQQLQLALSRLLEERPRLRNGLRRVIKCREIFGNW